MVTSAINGWSTRVQARLWMLKPIYMPVARGLHCNNELTMTSTEKCSKIGIGLPHLVVLPHARHGEFKIYKHIDTSLWICFSNWSLKWKPIESRLTIAHSQPALQTRPQMQVFHHHHHHPAFTYIISMITYERLHEKEKKIERCSVTEWQDVKT